MTRLGLVAGLSQDGAVSFAALLATLTRLTDEGVVAPCRGPLAHLWTSERYAEREAAAHRCATCPALDACQTHAQHERWHTWGGADRTATNRKASR